MTSQGVEEIPPTTTVACYPTTQQVLAALKEVRLREIETPESRTGLNAAHAALAEALIRVARTRESEALICWPSQPDGVSVVHSLACLALIQRAPFEPPASLRALYLPWNSRAGASAKRTLVDREWLQGQHIRAINRELRGSGHALGGHLFKWHTLMNRLKDLDGVVTHGGRKRAVESFRHPNLAETVAFTVCGEPNRAAPLLHRVRKHTSIGRLGASDGVDSVLTSPFALFGLPVDSPTPSLVGLCSPLNVILLNALQRRCDAVGFDWPKRFRSILEAVNRHEGRVVPVLAITDDTWIQHVLAKEVLPCVDPKCDTRRIAKSSVFMEPCRLTELRPEFSASGADQIVMMAPSGLPATIEDAFRGLINDAFSAGDREVGQLLLESRSAFRRFTSLPESLNAWKQYLFSDSDLSADEAADALAGLDARVPLNRALSDYPEALAVQCNRHEMEQLVAQISGYVERHTAQKTAAAEMFGALVQEALKQAGRAVVVLADERLREFYEHVIEGIMAGGASMDAKPTPIALASLRQFRDMGDGRVPWPSDLDQAIVLGPGRKRLMQLMGVRRLPRMVKVVADVGVARAVATDAAQLLSRDAFKALAPRLDRMSVAALECCERCASELPALDWQQPPVPEFDSGAVAGIVDLRADTTKGDGTDLRIVTDSKTVLLARPRSTIVRFDPEAPIEAYRADHAENIRPGDKVCVLSKDFFDWVHDRLGSGTAVAGEVRAYHQFVAEKVRLLPGRTYTEKAARVAEMMREKGRPVPESRVIDWIRADRWLAQDDATVRPHAPWHYEDFSAFLRVLGAPEVLASSLWRFGVLMTRSARLSAANQFSEMCISILTHTVEMIDQNRARSADVLSVVARAESTVATVIEVIRLGVPEK